MARARITLRERAFYDDLKRVSVAESLRAAQLETMCAFPHPFAWAAFGLTGVERPRMRHEGRGGLGYALTPLR